MKKLDRGGFTMVELLIVLAIIAILAAVAIPVYSSQLEASRKKVDESNLRAATGIAAQDYIVRNAGSTQQATDQVYKVFALKDTQGTNAGDAKNMLVYPVGKYVDGSGNVHDAAQSGGSGSRWQVPSNEPKDAGPRANGDGITGQVNNKKVIWYPVQQNGGNGTFDITISENGVVKTSQITPKP